VSENKHQIPQFNAPAGIPYPSAAAMLSVEPSQLPDIDRSPRQREALGESIASGNTTDRERLILGSLSHLYQSAVANTVATNPDAIEDSFQEGVVALIENTDNYRSGETAWDMVKRAELAADMRIKRASRAPKEIPLEVPITDDIADRLKRDPHEDVAAAEQAKALRKLMNDKLSERSRLVLEYRHELVPLPGSEATADGYIEPTYRAIANVLGIKHAEQVREIERMAISKLRNKADLSSGLEKPLPRETYDW
jgi:RNA polymerase sigma factor (sigma-70 family)